MKKTLYIFLSIFLLCILVSCGEQVEKKSYTIKFNTYAEEIEEITIDQKQKVELPVPQREGFIFSGWYPNDKFIDGTQVTNDTLIGKNITLHAKWEPTKVQITFDLDGGHFKDLSQSNTIEAYTNEEITLERVYKEDYLFMGWTVDGSPVSSGECYIKNTTIKAEFIALSTLQESYNVNLELNGGHMYPLEYPSDEEYWRPIDTFISGIRQDISTEVGGQSWELYYNFYEKTNNKLIGIDSFFGKSENYNKWRWLLAYIYSVTCDELKPYIYELLVNNYDDVPSSYGIEQAAIRLELNGLMQTAVITKNINGKDYSSYDYENLYDTDAKELEKFLGTNSYETGVGTVLPIPVRDGYTFMGWFDNPECDGEAVFEIPYNAYGDKQYYAKWQK